MRYADYEYYTGEYGGTMDEADFLRLSSRASAYLHQVTFGRLQGNWTTDTRVKDACCAVADAMLLNENGGGIASVNNDGYSVNYIAGVSRAKTDNQRLYEAAALYMGMTGLLYQGSVIV